MVDKSELEEATQIQEEIINEKMQELYEIPPNLITLTPLDLNAGYVLADSINVVSKAFEQLHLVGFFLMIFY